jgi:hypothetical protein
MAGRPKKSKRERELEATVAALQNTLQTAAMGVNRMTNPQRAVGDLWVGVRNISDLTVGIPSPFDTEPDLQLYANIGTPEPGMVSVISYAWWLQIRKGPHIANGLIIRDDRVLGNSWTAAPEDRAEDLPRDHTRNQIPDPEAWITSKTEAEIREGIAKLTAPAAMWRLRRVVDEKVREYQKDYPVEDENRAVKAYERLPALYVLVDNLTSQRLADTVPS